MTKSRKILWTSVTLAALVSYFILFFWIRASKAEAQEETQIPVTEQTSPMLNEDGMRYGYFAGGCFWCIESDFEKLDGVGDVISGYTGGDQDNPTYKQVTYQPTGHREAVKVPYDPKVVSYTELVRYFFRHIDPLDPRGQFCDKGPSYTTAIWVTNEDERIIAEQMKAEAAKELNQVIVTPILEAKAFWDAEGYHQDYYKKNPIRYNAYRTGCRRDARVKQVWGKK